MISAIVLAAGEATRFGHCKQLMPLGGKLLLEHVLDNLRQSGVDEVVVVLGAHSDEIQNRIHFRDVRVVLNPDYQSGMSTSIQAGLRALPEATEAAMIVLADQPLVTSSTLDALVDEYRRSHASVVVPTYNGFRGNPVIVDRALFAEMMEIRGDIGCRSIFGDHAESIVKVAVDDPGIVTDIDTPEDLERLVRARDGVITTSVSDVARSGLVSGPDSTATPSGTVIPSVSEESGGRGRDTFESGAIPTRDQHATASHPPTRHARIDHHAAHAGDASRATADLHETMVDLRRRRQPFAMATVVRAERPTSSKPGDKAIISPDGTLTGWIGGSCAHDIVVRNALESLEEGTPRFLTLSSASPAGTQRQGVIDIPMQCYSGGVLDVFIEPDLPRPQMVIVGYETVARALVRISKTLHFHVTVVDPLASPESVPEADVVVNELKLSTLPLGGESFIVVATHGRYDEEALEQAAGTDAAYIALVSSPRRGRVLLEQLRERGLPESSLRRIKSPAGLNIGAEGAEEIALSIVAEIVQERRTGNVKSEPAEKPDTPAAEPTTAIDPICNMTVAIADARYTAEHEGKRYYFCCQHCQRTFEKEPQRYVHVA
jgi:xanthine dehydrogenase accessory factor